MLAITGLQFHDLIGTHTQQDVALDKLFMDVCVYNERIMGPAHVENVVDLACRTAISYGGVAHVTIPGRFSGPGAEEAQAFAAQRSRPHQHASALTATKFPTRRSAAAGGRHSERRQEGRDPGGPRRAGLRRQLEQIAEMLAAPIVKALLGKAAVPDDSPYTTGAIGLLGTAPSQEAMEECDTLLMVGTPSLTSNSSQARPGAKACRSTSTPCASACAIPWKSAWWATATAVLENLIPLLEEARRIAVSWKKRRTE